MTTTQHESRHVADGLSSWLVRHLDGRLPGDGRGCRCLTLHRTYPR
mgnify:CR=1 FL=1